MEPVTPQESVEPPLEDPAVVITLPDAMVIRANERAPSMLVIDRAALPTSLSMSLVASDWDYFRTTIAPQLLAGTPWSGLLQFRDPEGVERRTPAIFVPHTTDGDGVNHATLLIDAQISGMSWGGAIDHLTNLPTRPVLLDRLEQALGRIGRRSTELAVLFLDLDGLKLINDRYGHETGDQFLVETAERLTHCLRLGDTVSRFGGDEFVILCEDLEHRELAHEVAERILDSLLRTDGQQVIGASIGIAFASDGDQQATDLVAEADAAMYRAKARGGRRAEVFDTDMQHRRDADIVLRRRLEEAISNDALAVAAQPIFELRTGLIRGVELFVRFAGDSVQPIGATEVLRLAREQTSAIDQAVLTQACALARVWRRNLGIGAPRTHVNISPQTLSSPGFTNRLTDLVGDQRVAPSALMIEVDETTIFHADDRHIAALVELRAAGFGLAFDGLARGQLPLRVIEEVRPHLVKIDTRTDPGNEAVANLQASAARRLVPLGVSVSAKGLEAHDQVRVAVASGVWAGQGQILHEVGTVAAIDESLFVTGGLGF